MSIDLLDEALRAEDKLTSGLTGHLGDIVLPPMPLSSDVRSLVWRRTSVAETVLRQMVEYREQVGARIRQLRLARGLTQDELADKIGVQEKTVSRWESGRHSGYQRNLNALAAALEVPPEEITGTPPAPLGLGARAEQIDGGFAEFRGHVAELAGQLDRMEAKLDLLLAHAGLTLADDGRPARVVEAVRDAAGRAGALPEHAAPERQPRRASR